MAQCPPGTFPHVIRPGDTFGMLAQQFGTSPGAIAMANPWANPWNLQVGQTLCIPGRPYPFPPVPGRCPPGLQPYSIQPGDTLGDIAFRRGVSVAEILRYNPVDPRNLRVGQVICLP